MPYDLHKASQVANYIVEQLQPHTTRIDVAGSIRRRRYQVKDIEILCLPKKEFIQKGLFPDDGEWLISREFSEAIAGFMEVIQKGNVSGRWMKILTSSKKCPGIILDLFLPTEEDYYRQLAIRTGSSEYVHSVIAAGWVRKGWCGVKGLGLRKISDCTKVDQKTWRLVTPDDQAEKPPAWQSEEEFFGWLGIKYEEPQYREFKKP